MPVTSATGSGGFTLLELLVVLSILLLMACAWPLAAPRLFPTQQLRNTAQQLAADVRSARMSARLTGERQKLELIPTGTGYQIGAQTRELPRGLTLQLVPAVPAESVSHLSLFPDGSSSGGNLDLALNGRHATVSVGPVTGRVEIVE
jgi:general secretion pathway protein H